MKYWLLSAPIHSGDIHQTNLGKAWPYERVSPDERLNGGDVVYLSFGGSGLYAWGHLGKKEKYLDDELVKDAFRVTVRWSVMRLDLVSSDRVNQERDLDGLFTFSNGNLVLLTVSQINAFNRLIRSQGQDPPPDPADIDEHSRYEILHAGRPRVIPTFTKSQALSLEETRYVEFKEVFGASPVNSIKATADEYAVALLNNEGGRIFWGVRDSDRVVVGLEVSYRQRDEIKKEVTGKLSRIQPGASIQEFSLEFYPVQDEQGQLITDLHVFELDVPRGSPASLYATGSNDVWMTTDAGKQKLTHDQLITEILRRKGL